MKCFVVLLAYFVIVSLVIASQPVFAETPVAANYAGGDGTAPTPYQISNLAELRLLSESPADWVAGIYFELTADIDASDTSTWNAGLGFSPIGSTAETRFYGSFDGGDHVITGLSINRPSQDYVALFGITGSGSSIQSVGIEACNVVGNDNTGCLIGFAGGAVSSSYSSGNVSGNKWVGGLYGRVFVSGVNSNKTSNVYSVTSVTGVQYVGGLSGGNNGQASENTLTSCYSTGPVFGVSSVGGLIGWSSDYEINTCYWDRDTSGRATSASSAAGLSNAQTVQQLSFPGLDFITTPDWAIVEGETRPYLPWQTAVLYEGDAVQLGTSLTINSAYIYNRTGSGVTLTAYGIAYREDGTTTIQYENLAGGAIAAGSGLTLDDTVITGLSNGTSYWYRAFAVDSNGITYFGTERRDISSLFALTPSVGTGSGSITPGTEQLFFLDSTPQFILTPAPGSEIANVGGSCGGTLNGSTFTVDPVVADCTVVANFAVKPELMFENSFETEPN